MLRKTLLSFGAISTSYYLNSKNSECCGIVGVLSKKRENISYVLSEGIELLKNRGYDSAGIVTFQQNKNEVQTKLVKYADNQSQNNGNCIQRVIQQVQKTVSRATVGIGHTRWATCGQKVNRNAHPHYDDSENIFLVHNGIIGKHSRIKIEHLEGVNFSSETDTEVVVQLIGKFRKQGKSMMDSIKVVEKILGQDQQWGLVIVDKASPDRIYTSTNKSPILIGLGDQEIFIASEVIAFQKHATEYFSTNDGENFQFFVQGIESLRERMKTQNRLKKINKDIKVLKNPPSDYKSFYSYEIRQQGEIAFNPSFERVQALPFDEKNRHEFLTMIACGSSYYAGQAAMYFFKALKAFRKVNIYDPVELEENDIADGQTVVMISQSGETADLLKIVKKCKEKVDVKTIGVINSEGSTLARKVDFPIYIKVGREVAVAATKSMFHQVLNLIRFATEVAEKRSQGLEKCQKDPMIKSLRDDLNLVPAKAFETIKKVEQQCKSLSKKIYGRQSIYLLAMREALPIARETALKIKELNYIHAQALGACEMKHGPIALIESDKKHETVIILWILDNETFRASMNAMDQMCSRNAYVVLVTDCRAKIEEDNYKKMEENPSWKPGYQEVISVPKMKHMSFLLTLLPMQILVEEIATLKGINPDMPRNLAKTVTV